MRVVILGLSITSSWGNGHAVTWRGLVRALAERGHGVTFLERDVPWYAAHRDLPSPPYGTTHLYREPRALVATHAKDIAAADLLMVGSFVPDGAEVARMALPLARGVTAFYDIDTPVTLRKLQRGETEYLDAGLMRRFDLYLSFTGGPVPRLLEDEYGCRRARHLPCAADPRDYRPETTPVRWDLGYLGTHSEDRRGALERLLIEPARRLPGRRFVVAGPGHPEGDAWPANVERIEHLPPDRHRAFYNAQRFTLNLTRRPMVELGWSPSVRLFEAAACGTPILTDRWAGQAEYLEPGHELLPVDNADDVVAHLAGMPEPARRAIGRRARVRVLREHTPAHRAAALERWTLAEPTTPVLADERAPAAPVNVSPGSSR